MEKVTVTIQTKDGLKEINGYKRWYDLDGMKVDLVAHRSLINSRYWVVVELKTGLKFAGDGNNRIEAFQNAVDILNQQGRENVMAAINEGMKRKAELTKATN